MIKLPLSKELITGIEYDSILVITDRLTKYIYILLYRKASDAKELVYIFLRVIVINYNILDKIISNRDKLFMSKF